MGPEALPRPDDIEAAAQRYRAAYFELLLAHYHAKACLEQLELLHQKRSGLTPRQQQVFALLKRGKSNKEIGKALHISERTVKFHVSGILERQSATDRYVLMGRTPGQQYLESSGRKMLSSTDRNSAARREKGALLDCA